MCAINGVTADNRELVERMNAATRHRGPDGTRIFQDRDLVTLGFNRLAIIDLSEKAMQPMQDASKRFTLVYNGELYNFKELKKKLSRYPFQSESDSEVILAAWDMWGSLACEKFNGMYAFALWDSKEESLTLARDPSGIKPLYYHMHDGALSFSSEIKALLEAPIPRVVNREAFSQYLRLMYVPGPGTMFSGIQKVLPGQILTFSKGKLNSRMFRIEPIGDAPKNYEDAKLRVRDAVEGAVSRQLVSDRPVGLYLSGGIDSSILLANAARVHPAINTYSVGYALEADEQEEKFNADRELAKETAAHFGSTHHEFLLSSQDALDLLMETVRFLDEPIGNATAISQLFLARKVKETATVVLTGDGGDELFGGYERYRLALLAERVRRFVPGGFARLAGYTTLHHTGVDRYAQLMFQKDSSIRRVLRSQDVSPTAVFAAHFAGDDLVRNLMSADEQFWLVDEALTRGDKMSMAGGIEARVPLLDEEVKHIARMLPTRYKVTWHTTKKILRDAFRKEIPEPVLNAPKRGWFSPGAKWMRRSEFVSFMDEVFTEKYAGDMQELINIAEVRALVVEHREKKAYHYTILFALLVFLVWAHEYKVSV